MATLALGPASLVRLCPPIWRVALKPRTLRSGRLASRRTHYYPETRLWIKSEKTAIVGTNAEERRRFERRKVQTEEQMLLNSQEASQVKKRMEAEQQHPAEMLRSLLREDKTSLESLVVLLAELGKRLHALEPARWREEILGQPVAKEVSICPACTHTRASWTCSK